MAAVGTSSAARARIRMMPPRRRRADNTRLLSRHNTKQSSSHDCHDAWQTRIDVASRATPDRVWPRRLRPSRRWWADADRYERGWRAERARVPDEVLVHDEGRAREPLSRRRGARDVERRGGDVRERRCTSLDRRFG